MTIDFTTIAAQIRAAGSLQEIEAIVSSFSAAAYGPGGVVYSGQLGTSAGGAFVSAGQAALELAEQTGASIIDNTARGQLLSNDVIQAAIRSTATSLYEASGETAGQAATSALNFIYGNAAGTAETSLSGSLWGQASREFASTLSGDITVIGADANAARIFGQVELPALLENAAIRSIGGQAVSAFSGLADASAQVTLAESTFVRAVAQGGLFTAADGTVVLSSELVSRLGFSGAGFQSAATLAATDGVVQIESAASRLFFTFLEDLGITGANALKLLSTPIGFALIDFLTNSQSANAGEDKLTAQRNDLGGDLPAGAAANLVSTAPNSDGSTTFTLVTNSDNPLLGDTLQLTINSDFSTGSFRVVSGGLVGGQGVANTDGSFALEFTSASAIGATQQTLSVQDFNSAQVLTETDTYTNGVVSSVEVSGNGANVTATNVPVIVDAGVTDFILSGNNDALSFNGTSTLVTVDGGIVVTALGSGETFDLSESDQLTLTDSTTGGNNTVIANGNDIVVMSDGPNDHITVNGDNDTVTVSGDGTDVTVNGKNDVINLIGLNETVTPGPNSTPEINIPIGSEFAGRFIKNFGRDLVHGSATDVANLMVSLLTAQGHLKPAQLLAAAEEPLAGFITDTNRTNFAALVNGAAGTAVAVPPNSGTDLGEINAALLPGGIGASASAATNKIAASVFQAYSDTLQSYISAAGSNLLSTSAEQAGLALIGLQYDGDIGVAGNPKADAVGAIIKPGSKLTIDFDPAKWKETYNSSVTAGFANNDIAGRTVLLQSILGSLVGTDGSELTSLVQGNLDPYVTKIVVANTAGQTVDDAGIANGYQQSYGEEFILGNPGGTTFAPTGNSVDAIVAQGTSNVINFSSGTANGTGTNLVELTDGGTLTLNSAENANCTVIWDPTGSATININAEVSANGNAGVNVVEVDLAKVDPASFLALNGAQLQSMFGNSIVIVNPTAGEHVRFNGFNVTSPSVVDVPNSAYNPDLYNPGEPNANLTPFFEHWQAGGYDYSALAFDSKPGDSFVGLDPSNGTGASLYFSGFSNGDFGFSVPTSRPAFNLFTGARLDVPTQLNGHVQASVNDFLATSPAPSVSANIISSVLGGDISGAVDPNNGGTLTAQGVLSSSNTDSWLASFQSVTAGDISAPDGKFTFDASTGAWTFTLDKSSTHFKSLIAGQTVQETMTVHSLDGASETVTVTVTAQNAVGHINETALIIASILDQLNTNTDITAITLTDPGTPSLNLTAAQAFSDTRALGLITNPSYGIAISDSAVSTSAYLDQLNSNARVTSIALTDRGTPTLNLTVAQATADTRALGLIANANYQIAISDTAANIAARFDALNALTTLSSITLTDSGTPSLALSVTQALQDTRALSAITNAAYAIAVTDTAANVAANLNALNAAGRITSITLSDSGTPALTLSAVQAVGDTVALGRITNAAYAINVADTAANISANIDALNADAKVTSITLADAGTLMLTAAQALGDTTALAKISSSYTVAIVDTGADIASISPTQANALKAAGYKTLTASTAVTMTAAEAFLLLGDGLAITGNSVTVADTVKTVLGLTTAQKATLTAAGFALAIADTAANIDALTTTQIASLSSSKVSSLTSTSGNLTITKAQAIAFETAVIRLSSASGGPVTVSDTAANLHSLTVAQIAALAAAGITSLLATSEPITFTVAQVAALEQAGVTVAATGSTVTLSDSATNFANLTAAEIAALPVLGINAVSVTGSVKLTVAQADAFELTNLKVGVPSGAKVTIADTAVNIGTLTLAEIAALSGIGVSAIAVTGSGLVLDTAHALALEAAGITLSVPTGFTASIADMAPAISALTTAQISALTNLHVTQLQVTSGDVTLSIGQALALETAKVSLTVPVGATASITDTAAAIGALTTTQIASLASLLHVSGVAASDAAVTVTKAQALAFETAGIALSAPPGAGVIVSDTAANLHSLTVAQIAALPAAGITELLATNEPITFTVAQVAALENAAVMVAAIGAVVTLSDSAANFANLTAAEITDLPVLGVNAVAATGSVALTVSQAEAFEIANLKVGVPSGAKVTISDTAANITSLTVSEIASLGAVGVSGLTVTGSGVTLSLSQALALEAAAITLAVPTSTVASIADSAAAIGALSTTQISGLTSLHVTQLQVTDTGLALSLSQALAFETAKVSLNLPSGATATLTDTAAALETLTTAQIAALGTSLHVTSISASDASLVVTKAQAIAFETAGIALSAPVGGTVFVSDTAGNLQSLTAGQLGLLPTAGITGLFDISGNVSFSPAQTSVILADNLTVAAAGIYTVTENFANGNYSVYQAGSLITQKSVNADGSYDIAHTNVTGQAYSAYEDIYNTAGTRVAEAQDLTNGSGNLLLYGNGLTIAEGAGTASVTTGADIFAITAHGSGIVAASGHTSETFAFSQGFGQEAITGFTATGSAHDSLQLNASMFTYLTPGMTQAQELAAVLAHSTQAGPNLTITDSQNDALTLNGITAAVLTANPTAVRFT